MQMCEYTNLSPFDNYQNLLAKREWVGEFWSVPAFLQFILFSLFCHSLLQGFFLTQGLNLGLLVAGKFFTIWATKESRMEKIWKRMYIYMYVKLNHFAAQQKLGHPRWR